jgi:hypothetical protein
MNADQSPLPRPLRADPIKGLPDRVLQKRLAGRAYGMAGYGQFELLRDTHSLLLVFAKTACLIILQSWASCKRFAPARDADLA